MDRLVSALSPDFPDTVLVVVHTAAEGPGTLWRLLARNAVLPVVTPSDGMQLKPGHVYVAPPDFYMTVDDGVLRPTRGPMEDRHRPAIDPLFCSAAQARDSDVVGVILTGYLDDGTGGLISIKRAGGLAVVQDPQDAAAPSMPRSAMEHVQVDYCLPLDEIAPTLDRLARSNGGAARRRNNGRKRRTYMESDDERVKGKPSQYTCPECDGTLWEGG